MVADEGPVRRRERQAGQVRGHRLNVAFSEAEIEVVRRAADRESMAPTAWAGHAVMAVAQQVLVPVSADQADVLRELVVARAGLREIAVRLDRHGPAGPAVPAVDELLGDVRAAVARVDEATLQVMRERRSRL
ncbi:hypothetical protein M8Z33_41845 [Streptomyces sp. ZAF1911]|uniref:hypothetical protein n=1 Tax=Streptomyces sp. ZAF1911 TaxID=2944129 RepID=UPI00237BD8EE|nr:hypothetical protein [Streptomyces sp. ZAF1911]MDD9383081.1 hypothetical protein [Streptomyces sp. ZAF1911]